MDLSGGITPGGLNSSSSGRYLLCYKASKITFSGGIWYGDHPFNFPIPLLLVQIILIFVASRLTHAVLRHIGQPQFVSHVVAGIILGPSLLSRNMAFRQLVFPIRSWLNLDIISLLACMLFIFVLGVKTDLNVIRTSGKKALAIAQFGTVLPLFLSMLAALSAQSISSGIDINLTIILHMSSRWAITSNSVLACLLDELNLLTTKLGRLALSASLIADLQHLLLSILVVCGSMGSALHSPAKGLLAFSAFTVFMGFIVFIARPLVMWMIRRTPEGGMMNEAHFLIVLLMALGCGLIGEMLGHNAMIGPLMLGLVLPGGPPLGTTLANRLDRFVSGVFLPIYTATAGLRTNLPSLMENANWGVASLLICVSSAVKFVVVLGICLYISMPVRDSVVVGLMMSCRGIMELHTINSWHDNNIMDIHIYAINILWIVGVGGLTAGLLKLVYKPSARFTTHKRRTVQHSAHATELHIMACVHHAENVPPLVTLLEASHLSCQSSPLCIYLLHLIPLVGHNTATLAPYMTKKRRRQSLFMSTASSSSVSDKIVNAFCSLEQTLESLSVVPFVGMSPYITMHEDICTLAFDKRAMLVILPFHMHVSSGIEHCNPNIQLMNINVLRYAPCSVAILIDHGLSDGPTCVVGGGSSDVAHHVVVFFLGGADDCEALAYGARMVNNPVLRLTVVRIMLSEKSRVRGEEERKDDEAVEEFKGIVDDKRVVYREEVVRDVEGTMDVLKKICEDCTLLIVGRREGKESVVTAGLQEWSEYPELGLIGDMMAMAEFGAKLSTLVVQQQVMAKKST